MAATTTQAKVPRPRRRSVSSNSDDSSSSRGSNAFSLTRDQQVELMKSYRPSSLPTDTKDAPLLFLSPDELEVLAAQHERDKDRFGPADEDDEEVDVELWEELVNDLLWTIPFTFLFSGMDYAVHAQYGQTLLFYDELLRLVNVLPALYLLTFLTCRPTSRAILPPQLIQSIFFILCIVTGISLIHITSTEGYLNVMKRAPALGTLWVWSVVRMDLMWAMAGLVGVAAAVYARGEGDAVIWWK